MMFEVPYVFCFMMIQFITWFYAAQSNQKEEVRRNHFLQFELTPPGFRLSHSKHSTGFGTTRKHLARLWCKIQCLFLSASHCVQVSIVLENTKLPAGALLFSALKALHGISGATVTEAS